MFASLLNPRDVADLLGIIAALLGTLTALVTLLTTISQGRSRPKERSALKFLRLERHPVEATVWRKRKASYSFVIVLSLLFVVIYTLLLFGLFSPQSGDMGRVWVYLVIVAVSLLNALMFFYFRIKLGRKPEDARTFYFQCATVEVEADFEMVFVECQRALKNMNAYALQFDYFDKWLEATVGASLKAFGGILCIRIEQREDRHYAIQVDMERRFSLLALTNSSWIMTSFLEQLLGK